MIKLTYLYLISLSLIILIFVAVISCGIFSPSDDCKCTQIEYTYDEDGFQFESPEKEIECTSELKAISEEGSTSIKNIVGEDGRLASSQIITCD